MTTKRLRLTFFVGAIILVWFLINLNGILTNPPITSKVIDADTMKPIEGALVIVEWTKTHGIGEHWTESYKVAETVTDKNGKFSLPGCFSSTVNEPNVTVYKRGYVAWSSRWLFPSRKNRTDYRWGDDIIKLEHFKEENSHGDHTSFISLSINSSLEKNYEIKKSMYRAIEWEEDLAFQERMKKRKLTERRQR